jgi:hypothetical protein
MYNGSAVVLELRCCLYLSEYHCIHILFNRFDIQLNVSQLIAVRNTLNIM